MILFQNKPWMPSLWPWQCRLPLELIRSEKCDSKTWTLLLGVRPVKNNLWNVKVQCLFHLLLSFYLFCFFVFLFLSSAFVFVFVKQKSKSKQRLMLSHLRDISKQIGISLVDRIWRDVFHFVLDDNHLECVIRVSEWMFCTHKTSMCSLFSLFKPE